MATIRPKYLTPVLIEHALSGDVVPFETGTYHASGVIDRTANPTFAEMVHVEFAAISGTPSGVVNIYIADALSTEFAFGAVTESVMNEEIDGYGNAFIKVGEIDLTGVSLYEPRSFRFNVASVYGGAVPPMFVVIANNQTGSQIRGDKSNGVSGSRYWAVIRGVQAETL